MIPKTPIKTYAGWGTFDADAKCINSSDISRDLTAYYELLARQDECDHYEHNLDIWNGGRSFEGIFSHCPKCGEQLQEVK